ncbi:hypothetical protein [Bacillus cereus]|uniref:hypothetical protein n=1 Tax=Bacillus cereus TaxID=1396 RepID=UPI0012AE36D9
MNNPKALADFNNRLPDILADGTSSLETPISLPFITLNDGNPVTPPLTFIPIL